MSKLRCPRCKVRCKAQERDRSTSSFCFTTGSEALNRTHQDEDDFDLRMWSYMEPPLVSRAIPLIPPAHLERVRKLIDNSDNLNNTNAKHIHSKISIQYLEDGSVVKTKSRTEIRRYSASDFEIQNQSLSKSNQSASSCISINVCGPDCSQISEEKLEEVFKKYLNDRKRGVVSKSNMNNSGNPSCPFFNKSN